jgi:hypothetical protein
MRRTLARTRDTLDVLALPPTGGTELNHRTRVTSDAEERHFTIRTLTTMTLIVVAVTFVSRLLYCIPAIYIFYLWLAVVFLVLIVNFFDYLKGLEELRRQSKVFMWVLAFVTFLVMSAIQNNVTAYLALGVAVGYAALHSHSIAKQYAYFITANVRVRVRTTRRWQRLWSAIPRSKGPRRLPEIAAYSWSFPLLLVPYASGFVALLVAEQTTLSRFSGAIGVATFLATIPTLWIILGDLGAAPTVPFFRTIWVSWRALVTWFCYNRHQTPAAGVFRFPTSRFQSPAHRDRATFYTLGLFAIAILSAASLSPTDVTRDYSSLTEGRRSSAEEEQTVYIGISPEDLPPGRDLDSGGEEQESRPGRRARMPAIHNYASDDLTSEVMVQLDEAPFLEQLPAEQKRAYLQVLASRRVEEVKQAEANRISISDLVPMTWVICSALSILLCLFGPTLAFFLVFWFVAGRLLTAYYDALEAKDAYEVSETTSPWDNRVERILNSSDPKERDHLFMGTSLYGDYPILLDLNLLKSHAHILGDTGSRKTSIGIAPMLAQLIAREDSSVLILDLKGDMGLFECARLEAKAAGIPFKWFTNITGRSSFVFNPFAQSHINTLTVNQRTQGIMQALGLEFGEGYGPSYFSAMHEIVLSTYMRKYRAIRSFKDLNNYLKDKNAYRGIGHMEDWENARHLMTLVHKLADVYPMNLIPADLPGRPELFEHQIDMPSLLQKKQVVYFYLASTLEPTTVSPVAKLVMFALLTAAARRGKGEKNHVYVFLDEFQRVVSENIKIFLEQARSMKLAFILANQTAGQLESSGTDLTDTVDSCTAFKQSFKATDLKSLKKLEESSGEGLYHTAVWKEAIDAGLREARDESFAIGHARQTSIFEPPLVQVSETIGPRLEKNVIIELSAMPMASFVRFTEGSGYTQFSGYYTPMISEYHISKESFEERTNADWRPDSEKTVITVEGGDEPGAGSTFVTGHPAGPPPPADVPDDFGQAIEERFKVAETKLKQPKPGKRHK